MFMKIVVLDGFTLNPGDQSWDDLKALGECAIYDRSNGPEIVARAMGHPVVLTNKTPLSRETIEQLPDLRYIGVLATGYNIVDIAAARSRGVVVTNIPIYGTRSVAQFTFALILELAHQVGRHTQSVAAGQWSRCPDFSFWESPLVELEGRTLGIVGMGRIGKAVADLAVAFGMNVLATTRSGSVKDSPAIRSVDLKTLFQESDIVSLHCPLTPETSKLINRERLSWMRRSAWLINTSRGGLVDEADLAAALNSGSLGAAALDVLSTEPPPASNPLFGAKNCWITPHMAWATLAARRRLMSTAVSNLRAFLNGAPCNVVSG